MKKRVLAFLIMLVLLACVLTVGASADATSERYQVGYAMKDINPYIYSETLGMGVEGLGELAYAADWTVETPVQNPVTGATSTERMICVPLSGYANSTERPSGGIIDDNGDGYTGIGDGLHITCTTVTDSTGTTLIYFTLDAISGYSNVLNDAAAGVVAALGGAVRTDHVFLNGSHTHEGADFGTIKKTITASSSDRDRLWRAYYDYVIQRMVDAAVDCYNKRTEAVMTKGSIDASDSSGYQLNYIRQYKVDEYPAIFGGKYSTVPNKTYIFGSNFGKSAYPEENIVRKRTVNTVSEADDTMHILQFTPTNGDKPIILVNWRSHATMMSGATGGGTGAIISSDYIGAFRYEMEKAGYRMAFLQGAAGNVVSNHALSSKEGFCPWLDDMPEGSLKAVYYGGQLLTSVALDCLENKMTDELQAGMIRSIRTNLHLEMQKDPEGLIAAATYYQENGLTQSNYKYTHTDGKVYILNSKHHARNVYNRSKASNPDTYANMTINAFMLGQQVAFVTAPTEMFDRYSLDATLTDTTDNDWDDIVDPSGYGTPFVMAYTNGHNGYTANKLSFSYNEGSSDFGAGSYEANTSRNAPGEGEKIIVEYGKMLKILHEGYKTYYCEHCKTDVQWQPLLSGSFGSSYTLSSGHYYLYEDVPLPAARNYGSITGDTVCLDLNGKALHTNCRAFSVTGKGTLNIMDSASGGLIESYDSSNSVGGGVISTSGGAVINLYGGTLRMITGEDAYVAKGGVIAINGSTVNIYGGVVDASRCQLAKDRNDNVSGNTDGCGAAIAVYTNGALNIFGGQVIAGKAEPEEGRADCVLVQGAASKITLSGDAVVDEFYFDAVSPVNFKISGNYTGTTSLRFDPSVRLYDGLDIGNLTNKGSIADAKVTCANSGCSVTVSGTNLVLTTNTAAIGEESYEDLQAAVDAASGNLIRLRKDVADDISINADAYIDLNGCSITGKVTVAAGKTLYCMDSATDDYTVSDGRYGRLNNLDGSVAGISEESTLAEDAYLMITENGETSFHRVNLQLTAMTLRASEAGIYYRSTFACDQMAAKMVSKFGVALNIKAVPALDNLDSDCKLSELEGFRSGGVSTSGNSTLLTGVMKTDNPQSMNVANASIPVHGRAYVLLNDGTYMFGASASRTFREQVELADAMWNDLSDSQKADAVNMFNNYAAVMENWNIPNIVAAAQTAA